MAFFSALWGDFAYALRRLRSSPGFTAAAIATIALGVGVNTGIFAVLNSVALRDLPVTNAEELVSIHRLVEAERPARPIWGGPSLFSTAEYRRYRDDSETLSGLLAHSAPVTATLGPEAGAEVVGTLVSCNYFGVLREPMVLGPGFSDSCVNEAAAPTVVLGHDLWVNAFGADPEIVGRNVLLNRQTFTVVGVAAEGMHGVDLRHVSFFAPLATQTLVRPGLDAYDDDWSWLTLIGRKLPETRLEQVRAELGLIAARLEQPQASRPVRLSVDRARPASTPEVRSTIVDVGAIVMTAFGLVLLIACANVANLVLARANGRSREIAVRLSLGASRVRIVQQLLVESVLIALGGGLLGVLLSSWSFQSFVTLALSVLPAEAGSMAIDARADMRVLGFALGLTFASVLLFGLAPALQASRAEIHAAAKAGAANAAGVAKRGPRNVLLGLQVAICMVLMIAAGLVLRGLHVTQTAEPGFDYENIAVTDFDLIGAGYDAAGAARFQRRLLERVAALPGVTGTALSDIAPLAAGRGEVYVREPGQDQWRAFLTNTVSPEYFPLLGIPVVQGRNFTSAERAEVSRSVIVTEAAARALWPDEDAVGQTLMADVARSGAIELTVVGVVRDAQTVRIGEVDPAFVYFPAAESRIGPKMLVKSDSGFAATAAGVQRVVAEFDPLLVVRVTPLEANLDFWRNLAGLVSALSMSLGALALLLASVGVYGVVAYCVSTQIREIGVRAALGAGRREILLHVLRRTMRPVALGAVVGILAAFGASRVLSSILFGVSPVDALGMGGAAAFVIAIAAAAGVLAAWPATSVNPMVSLRHE